MLAIALAFAASLSWGAADFTGGLKSRTVSTVVVLLFIEGVGLVLVLGYVLATAAAWPGTEGALVALAAGVAGTTGLFVFYRALAIGTMSVVAPISACGVALPVAVGAIGGDALSTITVLGMVVAFVGVVLASREGPSETDSEGSASRRSIVLALLAAVGFGTYFTLADIAAEQSIPWLLLLGRALAVVVLVAYLSRVRAAMPRRADSFPLIAAGALDVAATALYAVALNEGELSVVSVVGSLYPVVTVLLARVVLGEDVRGLQRTGVVASFCGVALIVLGS